jgi:hypothetical protein
MSSRSIRMMSRMESRASMAAEVGCQRADVR